MTDEKRLREAMMWREGPAPERDECARCGEACLLDDGKDPTPLCHNCAHVVNAIVADVIPGMLAELDALRAVEAAARTIADPKREDEARKSVILSGPFGPARTIRAMQQEARDALAALDAVRGKDRKP